MADNIIDGINRWDYPIEEIFASVGDTQTIPPTDPTLKRINYQDGFSSIYSLSPSQGGAYVPRTGFNTLFKRLDSAMQELQAKTSQITKGVTSQNFDFTQEWLPDGTILISLWGAADLPAGSGSSANGNDIIINLPYKVIPEHSGYSVMLRPPASSSGQPIAWITDQTSNTVTFHTPLYSASAPIHYHIDLKLIGDTSAYPQAPIVSASVVANVAIVTWKAF